MSRVAKNPVPLPKGVTATTDGATVTVKGAKGALSLPLRPGLSLVQEGQDLGARMAYAARSALTRAESVILVGTDCPDLSPEFLKAAIAGLEHQDAVLGPALDGGYVLLGLRSVESSLFERMPWGSDRVAYVTEQRLDALGWQWSRLAPLRDVDRPEDLAYLPARISPIRPT